MHQPVRTCSATWGCPQISLCCSAAVSTALARPCRLQPADTAMLLMYVYSLAHGSNWDSTSLSSSRMTYRTGTGTLISLDQPGGPIRQELLWLLLLRWLLHRAGHLELHLNLYCIRAPLFFLALLLCPMKIFYCLGTFAATCPSPFGCCRQGSTCKLTVLTLWTGERCRLGICCMHTTSPCICFPTSIHCSGKRASPCSNPLCAPSRLTSTLTSTTACTRRAGSAGSSCSGHTPCSPCMAVHCHSSVTLSCEDHQSDLAKT